MEFIDQSKAPNILKLKWKDCEKDPPKADDYYIVKYDQKKYQWFLAYYLTKEKKFLCFTIEHLWRYRDPQPWRWAILPRIKTENTLFGLELDEKEDMS